MSGIVRIEKTERHSVPYQIMLDGMVIALCPSEFTAVLIAGALNFKIEYERRNNVSQSPTV